VGACDALFTPRPLAPLNDIARQTMGVLLEAINSGTDRARSDSYSTGDPDPSSPLEEAQTLAGRLPQLQRLAAPCFAR